MHLCAAENGMYVLWGDAETVIRMRLKPKQKDINDRKDHSNDLDDPTEAPIDDFMSMLRWAYIDIREIWGCGRC